jgi:hypothetical protein
MWLFFIRKQFCSAPALSRRKVKNCVLESRRFRSLHKQILRALHNGIAGILFEAVKAHLPLTAS